MARTSPPPTPNLAFGLEPRAGARRATRRPAGVPRLCIATGMQVIRRQ